MGTCVAWTEASNGSPGLPAAARRNGSGVEVKTRRGHYSTWSLLLALAVFGMVWGLVGIYLLAYD